MQSDAWWGVPMPQGSKAGFRARGTAGFRRVVLGGGSVAIAAIAAMWFAERAFDTPLIAAFAGGL